jgi:hypothetical protein
MGVPRHSQRGSTGRIVAVVLAALVVGSAAVAGVAVFSTSGAAASSASVSSNSTASTAEIKLVYVSGSDSHVTLLRADGTEIDLNVSGQSIGPAYNLDDDQSLEVPYVTSNQELYAIDKNGEKQHLASNVKKDKTKLAVGDWDGDGTRSIYYANASTYTMYSVEYGGSPTEVADGLEANAALGVTNFTSDDDPDLVYVNGNNVLEYYNASSGTETKVYDSGIGSNADGLGVGAPRDFDGDGDTRVPLVDGSQNGLLVNKSGSYTKMVSGNVGKQPVAGVDWAGDSKLELVFLSSGTINYGYLNGTVSTLNDANGNSINAKTSAGIAAAHPSDQPLELSNFSVTNTTGQSVSITFDSNKQLASLSVNVTGANSTSLSRSDFAESGSGPYTYTATYDGSVDGNYTATMTRAESTDSDIVETEYADATTVDARSPSVDAVSLVDTTDGDGTVAGGDTVDVTATVTGDVGTVTADLSAFGAGSVTLTHASGDTYEASAQVDAGTTDGNYAAIVTARDGQGNQNASTTGTVEVDTADLTVSVRSGKRAIEGEQLSFSPESVGNADGDVTYDWAFGDGSSESGASVTHVFVSPGSYTVTLTATDANGDSAQATMTVDVVSLDSPETTTATTTATATPTTVTATTPDQATTTENPDTTATTTSNPDTTETTSERTTTDEANTPTTEDDDGGGAIGEAPGFGLGLAGLAMVGAALLARRE